MRISLVHASIKAKMEDSSNKEIQKLQTTGKLANLMFYKHGSHRGIVKKKKCMCSKINCKVSSTAEGTKSWSVFTKPIQVWHKGVGYGIWPFLTQRLTIAAISWILFAIMEKQKWVHKNNRNPLQRENEKEEMEILDKCQNFHMRSLRQVLLLRQSQNTWF